MYQPWPITDGHQPTPAELLAIYNTGYPGSPYDAAADEQLFGDGILDTFEHVCPHLAGLHTRDDRKVVAHFLSLHKLETAKGYKVLYGEEAQPYGNCVSRGSQHARATTNAVEIDIKGEFETYERPAWESTYRGRGHSGHGMNPATAARIDSEKGFLWRRDYPFANLSTQNAAWGRGTSYPAAVLAEMKQHNVGKWVRPTTGEQALDLFAAGYSCHSGQNVGFASRPNSQGYHPVSGRWNHDMATVGYDISRVIWPVDVVFVPNSWGDFNTQPSRWPETWPRIPGMITVRLEDWVDWFIDSKSIFFYCDIKGVPAKNIPNWGSHLYL